MSVGLLIAALGQATQGSAGIAISLGVMLAGPTVLGGKPNSLSVI